MNKFNEMLDLIKTQENIYGITVSDIIVIINNYKEDIIKEIEEQETCYIQEDEIGDLDNTIDDLNYDIRNKDYEIVERDNKIENIMKILNVGIPEHIPIEQHKKYVIQKLE